MAQEFTVIKAFLSTDKDTKEPQIIQTKGGDNHKYMVQVANQPVPGWMGILKKPGNEIKEGDTIYGDIVKNDWGKPQFNRSERPMGPLQGSTAPQTNSPSAGVVTLDDIYNEIKYVRGLLENQFQSQAQAKPGTAPSTQGDDDGPVDLSKLDY